MSNASLSEIDIESTRRRLTPRQAQIVSRLTTSALDELPAGVAPATAYTYFASKDHLVAEVFWRKLIALPELHVDRRRSPAARVSAALHDVGALVTDEPRLNESRPWN